MMHDRPTMPSPEPAHLKPSPELIAAIQRRPFPEAFTVPPIPPELCGVGGCSRTLHERGVFRDGTVVNGHSWER